MKKIILVGVVVVLVAVGVLTRGSWGGSAPSGVSRVDPADVVTTFYTDWLKALQAPSSANPNLETLEKSPALSDALRARIVDGVKNSASPDPVLCQTVVPKDISIRSIYAKTDEAQMLVTNKDKNVTNQAVVTLKNSKDGWYMDDIKCSAGEFAPAREFTFENSGFLLKASVPKPYNSKNWHLVFEENGQAGHVVPLLFDKNSSCVGTDGTVAVCKPEKFVETQKVTVHGQMTESGVSVKRLEVLK